MQSQFDNFRQGICGEPQAAPKAQAATSMSDKHVFSAPSENHENPASSMFFHLLRQCHKCGTSNKDGLWHCPRCGETLMKETLTEAPPPPPQMSDPKLNKSDDDLKQASDPRTYFQGVGSDRTKFVDQSGKIHLPPKVDKSETTPMQVSLKNMFNLGSFGDSKLGLRPMSGSGQDPPNPSNTFSPSSAKDKNNGATCKQGGGGGGGGDDGNGPTSTTPELMNYLGDELDVYSHKMAQGLVFKT